jgi:hypothetical protein
MNTNKYISLSWTIIASLAMAYLCYYAFSLHHLHKKNDHLKADLAEINKINYGLFDISRWKKEALLVFNKRIDQFQISEKAYIQVRKELDQYLSDLDKKYIANGKVFEPIFEKAEQNPKMNKMFLKLLKENTIPQLKELNIPSFIPGVATSMANDLRKQEPALREIMRDELRRMIKDTASIIDDPRLAIYAKYQQTSHEATNEILRNRIVENDLLIKSKATFVYGFLVFIFLFSWLLSYGYNYTANVAIMTAATMILLVIGITLPMISIEGLLNAFSINLLGTDIHFDQQYMYYQSKSIIDVTKTLLQSPGLDTRVVGAMILAFSVLFPFIKLVVSMVYLYSERAKSNKVIQNMIFYLGKWSMADVFVVALFMAYIGFYGVISAQLSQIERNRTGFAVETINNSHLSLGALFFTSFCIGSIIIGILINRHNVQRSPQV